MAALIVEPAFQEVTLSKNDSQLVEVFYTNTGKVPLLLTFATKNFVQDNTTGGIRIDNKGLASFLSPETRTLILEAGEKKGVKVRIENRESLSVGGSYGTLIAKVEAEGEGMAVAPSVAAFFLISKEGTARTRMSVKESSLQKRPVIFSPPNNETVTIENRGNIHAAPYGTVTITDGLKRTVAQGIVNPGSFIILPNAYRTIPFTLTETSYVLPITPLTLTIKGTARESSYSFSHTVWYVSPWFILTLLLILFSGVILWLLLKKR